MLHATTLACRTGGKWAGVLVQGPSGAGKSALALQLMGRGWRLVADDRTLVWRSGGRLFGRAPATLSGLIEARGLGVLPTAVRSFVELRLALACIGPGTELDRAPEPGRLALAGVGAGAAAELPVWRLDARNPGAAEALALLVAGLAL